MTGISFNFKGNISATLLISILLFDLSACGGSSSDNNGDDSAGDLSPITIGLPFKNYTIDSDSIKIDTGSGIVHSSIAPFGSHFGPLTGHTWGDQKVNVPALFARSDAELSIFYDSNGNGSCDIPADSCGFDGGADGADMFAMLPTYVAPVDATVTRVSQDIAPGTSTMYLNGQPHWSVQLQLSDRYLLTVGHLGSIAPALRDKILAATGVDTDTYTAGDGVNLINGLSIAVVQGEELAHPQLVATEVPGHPGFYNGRDSTDKYPWAQMEFTISDHAVNANVCFYDLLSTTEKASLNSAMIADMQSPSSARYGGNEQANIWRWGAEAVLCPVYYAGASTDFSDIHTHLGGWVERASSGVVRDELFSIIKIQTSSPMYNASNYDAGVKHLVIRERIGSTTTFNWTMPDTSTPGDIYYPVGEVLEETANSLLIKWREFSYTYTSAIYQRMEFELDTNGLKVKWGDFAASAAAAIQPVLSGDACNDTDVICYYHEQDLSK